MPDDERDEIEARVLCALSILFERDHHLLRVDVNERSITHRLGIYLQELFPLWDVDCEYNRHNDETKRLSIPKRLKGLYHTRIRSDDTKGKTVFPDIIVHERGTDCNLLVVEVKKTNSDVDDAVDIRKLRAFREQLGYSHALFLKIGVEEQSEHPLDTFCWIEDP